MEVTTAQCVDSSHLVIRIWSGAGANTVCSLKRLFSDLSLARHRVAGAVSVTLSWAISLMGSSACKWSLTSPCLSHSPKFMGELTVWSDTQNRLLYIVSPATKLIGKSSP